MRTAPFSGLIAATGADKSRKLMEELSSSAPVSGDNTGDVNADNWDVRFWGSEEYRSNPADPRSAITSVKRCSFTYNETSVR